MYSDQSTQRPDPGLEFWFDFASCYSYVSAMRIEELACQAGLPVEWRAFLLGPVFRQIGWDTSPFRIYAPMGRYMWKDIERQCTKYGVEWTKPSLFPRRSVLPARIAATHAGEPWIAQFCKAVMRMNFRNDQDIDDCKAMRVTLDRLGLDGATIVHRARLGPKRDCLRRNTEEAIQRGVFGAPTFFIGRDMFWGNDRLEDALALAAARCRESLA